MNLNQEIQHVELSLEEAKKIVEFGEALSRLEQNRDFQKVMFDGYFGDESRRLAFLLAEPNLNREQREDVIADLRAVGSLRQYLITRRQLAAVAQKDVSDFAEHLEELRAYEEGEGPTSAENHDVTE